MSDVWERLLEAFGNSERNARQTVYAYRLDRHGRAITPYLFRARGYFNGDLELLRYLQCTYGEGSFRVLIRDGSEMLYSGTISVGLPRQRGNGHQTT